MTNEELKICTRYAPHAAQIRSMDWCAWIEGKGALCGWGETEAEAIADLKENLE